MNTEINQNSAEVFAHSQFKNLRHDDRRVCDRVIQVCAKINQNPGKPFSRIFTNSADRKAAFRVVANHSLTTGMLVESICSATREKLLQTQPALVVAVQDTSSITREKWRKARNLGPVGCKGSQVFFFHSMMAMTELGVPIGLLDLKLWTRKKVKKSREDWKTKNIEKKESFRWLTSVRDGCHFLPETTKVIVVSDRESDIHEYLEDLISEEISFVVRVNHNRRTEGGNIRAELNSAPVLGEIDVPIPRVNRREKEVVRFTVQAQEVTTKLRKGGLVIHRSRRPFSLWGLLIKGETAEGKKLEWLLYTDQPIHDLESAREVVRIYTLRWRIEEFHMVLKTGMRAEKNRFQDGLHMQRLLLLCAPMAIKLLELMYLSRAEPDKLLAEVVSKEEEKAVMALAEEQTHNPPQNLTVGEAVKYIAFSGGWQGRKGDGPPGVRTLWEGWRDVQFLASFILRRDGKADGVPPCG